MFAGKPPEDRRLEILQAAEQLFITQGYGKTTVEHILQSVGIAKGTLYYHYQSKADILEAIVLMYVNKGVEAAENILAIPSLNAHEKLKLILSAQSFETDNKKEVIQQIHRVENAELHMKSLTETIKRIAPIIAKVIEQGVEEGIYQLDNDAQEVVEFLLVASQFLLDTAIFDWTAEQLLKRAQTFQSITETVLHAEKGSFHYITVMYERLVEHFELK
ncbi:TetR family transcriptional regulator [Paenibacillus montaniterrae]|uniref:TetR family transcriptional regulator n=1 Tax=Paenibacillus montaniterrae TaxID=429341 RepID=A0A920CXI6_9BACL|nr:TetR/AcrR family transcriptional regulator [Paenibacillus montaniterrae]GIP15353.1 TetR family transcriptional regulator [Paenibacillus montaniterrae]